jgi:hypothetical protein
MSDSCIRLYEQTIDILVYDFINKYQSLKTRGIDKDKINDYMNEYQRNRIKNFTDDMSRIKAISNPLIFHH